MNRLDLEDNVAIVTGGAQGIGLAVAERILASGGSVALWDRDEAQLGETASRLGDRALAVPADIGDPATVRAATEATMERFGRSTS